VNLKAFSKEVYDNAYNKGFWPFDTTPIPSRKAEKICLMHSELSEALEGVRKPGPDKYCPEFSNEEIELADCFIRILDYCEAYGIRLEEAAIAKHAFNKTRPYKHGKTL
jgi:NTP pyrophosphatase (non-canonical NTP hydrolase)